MADEYLMILHNSTQQAWSNTHGWVDHDDDAFDLFTLDEALACSLPMGGRWRWVDGGSLPDELAQANARNKHSC